jgi:hypothetical protein
MASDGRVNCEILATTNGYLLLSDQVGLVHGVVCFQSGECNRKVEIGRPYSAKLPSNSLLSGDVLGQSVNGSNSIKVASCGTKVSGSELFPLAVPIIGSGLVTLLVGWALAWTAFQRTRNHEDERAISVWLREFDGILMRNLDDRVYQIEMPLAGSSSISALAKLETAVLSVDDSFKSLSARWATLNLTEKRAGHQELLVALRTHLLRGPDNSFLRKLASKRFETIAR